MKSQFFFLGLVLMMMMPIPISATTNNDCGAETYRRLDDCGTEGIFTRFNMDPQAEFAGNLLKKEVSEHQDENVLLSPTGAQQLLAMLMNGSSGDTFRDIVQTLGFSESLRRGERTAEFINFTNKMVVEVLNEDTTMNMCNSIWLSSDKFGSKMSNPCKKRIEENYSAVVNSIPFNEVGVKTINEWVKVNTRGKTQKIVESFSPNCEMLLINCSAFTGKWKEPGTPWENHGFATKHGEKMVDFIEIESNRFFEINGTKVLTKEYEGGYHFVLLLPEEDISKFLNDVDFIELNMKLYHLIRDDTKKVECRVYIPKFSFNTSVDFKKTLGTMVPTIFEYTPELGGLFEHPMAVKVETFLQKNSIQFNELGTTATSATLVEMVSYGYTPYIIINKPFVFLIYKDDGIIVYEGIINDPTLLN